MVNKGDTCFNYQIYMQNVILLNMREIHKQKTMIFNPGRCPLAQATEQRQHLDHRLQIAHSLPRHV